MKFLNTVISDFSPSKIFCGGYFPKIERQRYLKGHRVAWGLGTCFKLRDWRSLSLTESVTKGNECVRDDLIVVYCVVCEERGLRHYKIKKLKLLIFILGAKCRCLLMRAINTVGQSVMWCGKFVISRTLNMKIQSLLQRCYSHAAPDSKLQGLFGGSLGFLILQFQIM